MAVLDNILQGGKTEGIANILRQRSGKLTQATGPKTGSMMERIALADAVQKGREQAQQTTVQGQALQQQVKAQEQQTSQAVQSQSQQYKQATDQLKQQTAELLQGSKHSNEGLTLRQDGAKLEQAAFNIRLQNDKYIQELQLAGRENRLTDQQAFEEEALRLSLGEGTAELEKQFGLQRGLNSSQRDWEEQMSKLSLDSALAMANQQVKDYNAQQMWSGGGQILQAGVSAMGKGWKTNSEGKLDVAKGE